MKILFLHGWHSVSGGVKPTYFKNHGWTVINPVLDDDDFSAAVSIAQAAYDQHLPDVIIGSSRCGAVAMNIVSHETPLVLLCPAWKKWGNARVLKSNSLVLHSRNDDVISFHDSEDLIAQSNLPPDTLIEVGNDHRLADESSLDVMLWACGLLAAGEQLPLMNDDCQTASVAIKRRNVTSEEDASYICDACGEVIVIPLDLSEGTSQTYVEDCPVCCRANTIHVQIDDEGVAQIWAEPEQDYN